MTAGQAQIHLGLGSTNKNLHMINTDSRKTTAGQVQIHHLI